MAKPISETLRLFQGGDFNIKAGELFASVLRGVEDTGKAGKLTITLDVKQQNGAVAVLAKVTDKTLEVLPDAPEVTHATFVAPVMSAFDCKFPSHPRPSAAWWAEVRAAGQQLQGL